MSQIYLVRHGQASFGSRDYDQLSPLGVTQAELLGQWLAASGLQPGHIYHGNMKRHRQTVDACLSTWLGEGASRVVPMEESAFNEFDHKEVLLRAHPMFAEPDRLERFMAEEPDPQRTFQELFAGSVTRWIAGKHNAEYTEIWPAFQTRCMTGLKQVAEKAPGDDVWVFTSGGTITAITQHVLGIPDDKAMELLWTVLNGSVSQFAHRQGKTRLRQFNSVAHLTLPGRAELHSYR
jgi:broad specificity phosphatase PhoE